MGDPEQAGQTDPQELMARLQQIQQHLQGLQEHIETLEQQVGESQQAQHTLEGLQEVGGGERDVLLPVGGGVQVQARVDPTAKVVMQLGAGYATEGDIPAALAQVKAHHETVQERLSEASAEAQRLAQEGQMLQQRLQQAESVGASGA